MMSVKLLHTVRVGLALCVIIPQQASAQPNFYRGKTVTLVVGYSAGGDMPACSRAISDATFPAIRP